jgi:hypothetical protein
VVERPSRAPIVVIALLVLAFAGVIAALMMKPKTAAPPPIVSTVAPAPVTTTTAAPAPTPAQSTIEVKTETVAPVHDTAPPPPVVKTTTHAPTPVPAPVPVPVTHTEAPPPAPAQNVSAYIEGGDGDANDAVLSSAQHALAGTKRVAVRASDARWSAELTRQLIRHDIAVADDADVIIHFDGALEHLGRGRKRRSASASVTKSGRTVFRYELKPEEYRVGDDPAEAFARILGDVLR